MVAGPYPTKQMFEGLKGRVTTLEGKGGAAGSGGGGGSLQVEYAGAGLSVTPGTNFLVGDLTEIKIGLPPVYRDFAPLTYDGVWIGTVLKLSDLEGGYSTNYAGGTLTVQPYADGTLLLFSEPIYHRRPDDTLRITLAAPKSVTAVPQSQAQATLLTSDTTFTFNPPLEVPGIVPLALVRTSLHFPPGPVPAIPTPAPTLGDTYVAGVQPGQVTEAVDSWVMVTFNGERAGEMFDTIEFYSPDNFGQPKVLLRRIGFQGAETDTYVAVAEAVHFPEAALWRITLAQPQRIEEGVMVRVEFNITMTIRRATSPKTLGVVPWDDVAMYLVAFKRRGVPGQLAPAAMNVNPAPSGLQRGDFEIVDDGAAVPRLRYRGKAGTVYTLPMTAE